MANSTYVRKNRAAKTVNIVSRDVMFITRKGNFGDVSKVQNLVSANQSELVEVSLAVGVKRMLPMLC